jgi:hypothetical protein
MLLEWSLALASSAFFIEKTVEELKNQVVTSSRAVAAFHVS